MAVGGRTPSFTRIAQVNVISAPPPPSFSNVARERGRTVTSYCFRKRERERAPLQSAPVINYLYPPSPPLPSPPQLSFCQSSAFLDCFLLFFFTFFFCSIFRGPLFIANLFLFALFASRARIYCYMPRVCVLCVWVFKFLIFVLPLLRASSCVL